MKRTGVGRAGTVASPELVVPSGKNLSTLDLRFLFFGRKDFLLAPLLSGIGFGPLEASEKVSVTPGLVGLVCISKINYCLPS